VVASNNAGVVSQLVVGSLLVEEDRIDAAALLWYEAMWPGSVPKASHSTPTPEQVW
jgi:hypothetical protein